MSVKEQSRMDLYPIDFKEITYEHTDDKYIEDLFPDGKDIRDLFQSEADAIFSLYEELFCNQNHICKKTVLESMQYLIFSKGMENQMEEIEYMDPCDVDAVHHREVEKEVLYVEHEMKNKLYKFLENEELA